MAESKHKFLTACHECDLLQSILPVEERQSAKCIRCEAVLYRHKPNSLMRTLAFTVTGLILLVMSNSYPFLSFKLGAQTQHTTLINGVIELSDQGLEELAVLVLLTTFLIPMSQLLGLLYVLLPLTLGRQTPWLPQVFRWTRILQPWSMMEVFMLGILVSYAKLAKMAQIFPGISFYSFLFLIFVMAAVAESLDSNDVWERLEYH